MEHKKLHTEFKKGIKEIKTISMTSQEKSNILEHIMKGASVVECPIESPYVRYSFASMFSARNLFYASSFMALFIIIGSGAAFASVKSLPGNILYPLKVKVVEPAQGVLIRSNEEKVKYESSLITKRFIEAETLATIDKLDEAKENQINSLIETHTKAFSVAAGALRKTSAIDDDTDDDIAIDLQAQMNAHAQVLEAIREQKQDPEKTENVTISKTARTNAAKIREDLKNKERKNQTGTKKTKDIVQSLIDKTNLEVTTATSASDAAKKQQILTNTSKALDEARALLKQVDDESQKGNSKDAHERLLDSESSAKTANILLNLGLKLGR